MPPYLPLHPRLSAILHNHKKAQFAQGLNEHRFVFPTEFGTMRTHQANAKTFKLAEEASEVGIHVTAQVLRRSFNTLMVTAGVNPITLRAVMGHNSKKMTELYSGVPLEEKKDAILTAFRS